MKRFLILQIMVLSIHACMNAQAIHEITVGVGLPEMFNVGYRLGDQNIQLGTAFGIMPQAGGRMLCFSPALYVHMGKLKAERVRKATYFNMGFTFYNLEDYKKIEKGGMFNIRIGWDISGDNKNGIMIDLGIMTEMYSHIEYKEPPTGFNIDLNIPMPSIGMRAYFGLPGKSIQ